MASAEVGGKVILLYKNTEAPTMEASRDILKECGVIAIPCTDPNNFRFVVPEVVCGTQVDLIGRLALQALGTDKPLTNFALAIRGALAPPSAPQPKDPKKL